jgi:rsbT co-antagonist protein RsbR
MNLFDSSASQELASAENLADLYRISTADLDRVRSFGERAMPQIPAYVDSFYVWLEGLPEFDQFFPSREKVEQVKKLQIDYWQRFFAGRIDEGYVAQRRTVGEMHARIGLSLPTYFAAMNLMLDIFTESLNAENLSAAEQASLVHSLTKQLHLDTSIVVETFSRLTSQTIAEQSQSLIAMSTPVTAIWRGVLLLPIVGVVDSKRAQEIMNAMLTKIAEAQSKVIILDISGVAVVDTAVANHLIKITKATRLMGCECTISGVSPAIAQTIVELGIDVGEVHTTNTLRDALQQAFQKVGLSISEGS